MQILTTKLYIQSPRSDIVTRRRLLDQLDKHTQHKLTLISAPAGFGKTTLVSEWITQSEQTVAWLSLDDRDGDPIQFITYMVAALQTVIPEFGSDLIEILPTVQPNQAESIMISIINELAHMDQEIIFVLDDYHVVDAVVIDDIMVFLLEHMPAQMHLIITTREDPSFPTSRLRARRELNEIRANDLRFTVTEATEFLNQHIGLNLSEEDVSKLEARTEGWIAGLQMVAISLSESADTSSFIESFTGSHRFILDYLVDEVLASQPQDVVDFLLQTSILDRLCGELCDAVTGQQNGQHMLELLERRNMLVVPLDNERNWYRYHHLFADVLQAHLKKEQPEQIPVLHRRAGDWYAQNGWQREAIHHALIAEDYALAANLIELNWQQMDANYASAAWISQVRMLPESTIRYHPVLCAGYGWTLLYRGEFEASERWFQRAEHWLNTDERDGMRVADPFQFEMLPASLNSARAYQAMARGDLVTTLHHAQRALQLAGDADHASRTQAMAVYGLAQWANGDLSAADITISTLIDYMQQAGRIADALELMFVVGDIRITCGRLHSAYRLYQRGFEMLATADAANLIGVEDLYRGVVDVYREWGDWNAAEHHLMKADEFGRRAVSRPDWHHRLNMTAARLAFSQGDFDRTLELLELAQEHYTPSPIPRVRPATALQARVWIKQGDLSAAANWADENSSAEITYLTEFDHITYARLLIAQDKTTDALKLLNRLHQSAQAGDRMGRVIEILVLQALAYQRQGDQNNALIHMHHALNLAEPEGYIRVFADEGQSIRNLLATCLTEGIHVAYVMRLIGSIEHSDESENPPSANELLIEPLSNRELEVLGLIAEGFSNQAIADELVIALSTVKKHVNNVMGKLDVNNRTQAVNRARELGLL